MSIQSYGHQSGGVARERSVSWQSGLGARRARHEEFPCPESGHTTSRRKAADTSKSLRAPSRLLSVARKHASEQCKVSYPMSHDPLSGLQHQPQGSPCSSRSSKRVRLRCAGARGRPSHAGDTGPSLSVALRSCFRQTGEPDRDTRVGAALSPSSGLLTSDPTDSPRCTRTTRGLRTFFRARDVPAAPPAPAIALAAPLPAARYIEYSSICPLAPARVLLWITPPPGRRGELWQRGKKKGERVLVSRHHE